MDSEENVRRKGGWEGKKERKKRGGRKEGRKKKAGVTSYDP